MPEVERLAEMFAVVNEYFYELGKNIFCVTAKQEYFLPHCKNNDSIFYRR
jgi:hypothetical protein